MNVLENKIYEAIEAEEEYLDTMPSQSIGAYNQRMTEHLVNVAELEEKLEIEKALFRYSRDQFRHKVNSLAYDLGEYPVYDF